MASSDPDPEIAGYRVIDRLGAGGMGEVYLVAHPRLPRRDALKLLDAAVSRNPDFQARFIHEADLLAPLSHPNIVHLYDRGRLPDGRLWLTMEYLDGTDARQLLREHGPLPLRLVAEIVSGVAAALDYAYLEFSITHRDVKPANVLVRIRDGHASAVKLLDFGIAKATEEVGSLTATGMTVGTLGYLSPEAIDGRDLDNRTDLYSLATAAFELLTGTAPYRGETISAVMGAHLYQPVPSIHERVPRLPADLDPIFARALAKDPNDRFPTSGAFAAALAAVAALAPDEASGAGGCTVEPGVGGDPQYAPTTVRPAPAPAPAQEVPADRPAVGPAVELRRGQVVDLPADAGTLIWSDVTTRRLGCDLFALIVDGHDRVLSDDHLVFYNNRSDPDGIVELVPEEPGAAPAQSVRVHPDRLPAGIHAVIAAAVDGSSALAEADPTVSVRCPSGSWRVPLPPEPDVRAATLFDVYHRTDPAGVTTLRLRAVAQGWTGGIADLVRDHGVQVEDG